MTSTSFLRWPAVIDNSLTVIYLLNNNCIYIFKELNIYLLVEASIHLRWPVLGWYLWAVFIALKWPEYLYLIRPLFIASIYFLKKFVLLTEKTFYIKKRKQVLSISS